MISLDPENKCGVFCYKDEKFSILAAGTVNSFFFFFFEFYGLFSYDRIQENEHWSSQDRSEVESFFKLMPDTSPCDLAIISRKLCFEVRVLVCLIIQI